jgi:hypothetical protein
MRIAVDSDLFFYSLDHSRDGLKKRGISPSDIKNS